MDIMKAPDSMAPHYSRTATAEGTGEEGDEFDAGCLDANDNFDDQDRMEMEHEQLETGAMDDTTLPSPSSMQKDGSVELM
jgi:hypothetical protein